MRTLLDTQDEFAEALLKASMTDKTYLRREFLPLPPPEFRKAMHKMAATAMHAEYGLSRRFLVRPFFLPPGGAD